MKVCPNCGNTVEDVASFCDNCGSHFKSKKKKTGVIIGIVVAVLIVLAIAGASVQNLFRYPGYYPPVEGETTSFSGESELTTENNNSDNSILHIKGSIVDGWYINEWANMRFDTRENWTIGSSERYEAYENTPNVECGIILNDTINKNEIIIYFEKIDESNQYITEWEYLDIITDGLKQNYEKENYNCTVDNYYDVFIAGEQFKTARITFEGYTAVQDIHVRKCDDYMIGIMVTSKDVFSASYVINNIQTVN